MMKLQQHSIKTVNVHTKAKYLEGYSLPVCDAV